MVVLFDIQISENGFRRKKGRTNFLFHRKAGGSALMQQGISYGIKKETFIALNLAIKVSLLTKQTGL